MISFTGPLGVTLANIGIALVAIAIIVAIIVWRGRRRGSTTIALDAALTLSGWWIALSTVGALIIIVKAFAVDWAELDAPTGVWLEWPGDLPCAEFGAAGMLTCGGTNLSTFTVGGASLGLRLLAATAQLSSVVVATIPAAMLAVICFHTLRGRTFSRVVPRVLTIGAGVVLVAGIAAQLTGSTAATMGLREVFDEGSEWYPAGFSLTVTPEPFVGSLALLALAAVFRHGMRMQHQNEKLQKDTEGLV